jgi:hypothetical protein
MQEEALKDWDCLYLLGIASHPLCQLGLIFQWVWHCHQLPTKEHIPSKVLLTIAAAYEAESK